MGNRPGRSKGCITCRRRKVKCDESRPLCTRCAKSGNKCEGYQDSRTFVWVEPKSTDPKQAPGITEASSSSVTADAAASTETFSVQPTSAAHQEAFFAFMDPGMLQTFIHPVLPPELDDSTFRESIYQTHLFQHLLGYTETSRNSILSVPIMNSMDLNRDSVNALSMTFLGRIHHLPEVSHQGDLLYSKAILQLAAKLNAGSEALSTPVLRAILSLTVHEIVNCSAYNGWIQHVGGIERLIEARGPWRHQSVEERILFESCRPLIIAKAMSDEKRTFLEQPKWQETPWTLDPSAKSHQSRIFDVLSFFPGLLEDLAKISDALATTRANEKLSPDPDSALNMNKQKQSMQITIDSHLSFLNQWYQSWSAAHQDAVQKISSPLQFGVLNTPYPLKLFGKPLLFSSLVRANEYTLYNLAIFLLLTVAGQLSSPALGSQAYQTQPTDEAHVSTSITPAIISASIAQNRRQAATEICKAVPYHLQFDLHAFSGAYLLCFPLNVLVGIKGTRAEEGQWVADVLEDITSNWGIMAGNAWLNRPKESVVKGKGTFEQNSGEEW